MMLSLTTALEKMRFLRITFKLFVLLLLSFELNAATLNLRAGWNLVGTTVDIADINALIPNANRIWKYTNGVWSFSSPNKTTITTAYAPLSAINAGEGFWVHVNSSTTVELSGGTPLESTLYVKSGWNLLSLKSASQSNILSYRTNSPILLLWKRNQQQWEVFSPDIDVSWTLINTQVIFMNDLQPLEGVWVFATSDVAVDENGSYKTPFSTLWEIPVEDKNITIPTYSGASYDYTVDWGDGQIQSKISSDATHSYSKEGNYTVKIYGTFPRIYFNGQTNPKIREILSWGDIKWQSMSRAFMGCTQLDINASDKPDLSSVTDMSFMFFGDTKLNYDINNWDVSHVTDMSATFFGTSSFNQSLKDWNVSNVINMSSMFGTAISFNQDLSSWDVSHVTNMSSMFYNAQKFNQDVSSWNVANAQDLSLMFKGATSFNQDLSSWNTSNANITEMFTSSITTAIDDNTTVGTKVAYINAAVSGDRNITEYSVNDTAHFLVSSTGVLLTKDSFDYDVQDLYKLTVTAKTPNGSTDINVDVNINNVSAPRPFTLLWNATANDKNITIPTYSTSSYDYSVDWGDGNIQNHYSSDAKHTYATEGNYTVQISGVFPRIYYEGTTCRIQKILQWGNGKWESMSRAFRDCNELTLDATDTPNLSRVTDMSFMFAGNTKLDQDMSSWNVSNVTNMSAMFFGTASFNQNISSWDVSHVSDMSSMFQSATSFNQDLSAWNVSSASNMSSMFFNALKFNQNLSGWNVSSAQNLSYMFRGATSFNQDLSTWNVSNVTSHQSFFDDNSTSIEPTWP